MEKKYIIKLEENEIAYKTVNSNGCPMIGLLHPAPYTEPDLEQVRKEAYQKGYEDGYNEPGKNQQEAYQRGLNDAWEAVSEIAVIPYDEVEKIFGATGWHIFMKCTASEAIEKLKAYEQETIQIGDEVRNIQHGWTAVVSAIDRECMTLMDTNGKLGDGYDMNRFIKTGRHFPEIATILEKMRGEQDG